MVDKFVEKISVYWLNWVSISCWIAAYNKKTFMTDEELILGIDNTLNRVRNYKSQFSSFFNKNAYCWKSNISLNTISFKIKINTIPKVLNVAGMKS